jgi:hypothetical protein
MTTTQLIITDVNKAIRTLITSKELDMQFCSILDTLEKPAIYSTEAYNELNRKALRKMFLNKGKVLLELKKEAFLSSEQNKALEQIVNDLNASILIDWRTKFYELAEIHGTCNLFTNYGTGGSHAWFSIKLNRVAIIQETN